MSGVSKHLRHAAVGAAALAAFGIGASANAETNLAGKTIQWTIPFSETGGSAKWANFFAPLLGEALPGSPKVVVRFMPGAGSTKGANWFQKQKNGDGTVMFGSSGSTQFPYLLGDPRVRYEYKDWKPVMATGTGGVAYLPAKLGGKFDGSANKLKGEKFIYGSQGATRLDLVPILAWKMLGLNVEPVFGIKSRGAGRLMFERGEANIDYQTSSAYLKSVVPLVKDGKAVPMMTWGSLDSAGNIVRDPTFPDIPTFIALAAHCQTSIRSLPSMVSCAAPYGFARSAMLPDVTVEYGENSENPLFSQTKITGSFHRVETFNASHSTPWLAAPSPKKATPTAPLPSS